MNDKITVPGPLVNGINYDLDLIYLWLYPQVDLSLTSSSGVWTFAGADRADITFAFIVKSCGWFWANFERLSSVVAAVGMWATRLRC
jgi:hypothetical protein